MSVSRMTSWKLSSSGAQLRKASSTLDLRLETSSNPFPIDYHGPDFDIHGNNRTSRVIVPQRPRKLFEIGVIDVYSFYTPRIIEIESSFLFILPRIGINFFFSHIFLLFLDTFSLRVTPGRRESRCCSTFSSIL